MNNERLHFIYPMTLSPESSMHSLCFKGETGSCFFYILQFKPVFRHQCTFAKETTLPLLIKD